MTRSDPPLLPAHCRAALAAAARGPLGANPRVGAVLISSSGDLLSVGYHRGAGTLHAEADALAQARRDDLDVQGATCIVTLEPCAHEGRTPSCAKSLIRAGIDRVLYAIEDPHTVASGGAKLLSCAGIKVHKWVDLLPNPTGIELTREAANLNDRWLIAKREGRPFVSAKIAQTLDGKVAAADGTSQWITGSEARKVGHELRSKVDAIMVGTGTLLADNPSLTARDNQGELLPSQPLRVVIGERSVPADARVRGGDARFVHIPSRDLSKALASLAREQSVEHVLIEGGPGLISAALRADLVDDLFVHLAPTVLGAGTPSVSDIGVTTLADRQDFTIVANSLELHGEDLTFHAVPRPRCPHKEN